MRFFVNFGFPNFFRNLRVGSEVYKAVYSESNGTESQAIVLLTSDVNGTIHALRLRIKAEKPFALTQGDEALALASDAAGKIEEFLKNKGAISTYGLLLTAGLQDALKYWG